MQQPIRVYTPDMTLLDETDNYISLQFMPKFYEVGSFELHINEYVEGSEYFQKGNIIVLNKRFDKAMIIRHREIQLDESGRVSENWKITGVTLEGILDKRVTIPPSHTSHDRISGSAEKVMKHYVDNHFVNPNESKRKIEQIEIAPNRNRGKHIKWESRYKNIAEELSNIAKQANIGWVMYADMERKKWVFDVVEPRDVTKDNKEGLQPVFFSPDFSTIKSQSFVDSNTNYKNVGYVGGQGEGIDRKIIKLGDGEGLERSEVFIDARDVGSEDEEEEELTDEEIEQQLIERGQEKMREFETTFYLEAQILTPSIHGRENTFSMSTPFEYEKDFRLGDTVEVFNKKWRIKMKAPITEFKEVHEHGGFILEATFGEAQPTLITKIKEKFDAMDGIEKQELPAKLAVMRMKEAMGYSDKKLTEEEKARIKQAQENLALSLEKAGEKAQQAKNESMQYADERDIIYDDIAKRDASEKSELAERNANEHTRRYTYAKTSIDEKDNFVYRDSTQYAKEQAELAEQKAKEYAVSKDVYNAKVAEIEQSITGKADLSTVQNLADDVAVKVDGEWVESKLLTKADKDNTYTKTDIDGMFDNTVSKTQYTTDKDAFVNDLKSHETRIYQTEKELGAKAERTELQALSDDVGNIGNELSQAKLDIQANADSLKAKADSSKVNTLEGTVNRHTTEIDVLSTGLDSKVDATYVQGQLNNLEIGGRNLFVESNLEYIEDYGSIIDVPNIKAKNFTLSIHEPVYQDFFDIEVFYILETEEYKNKIVFDLTKPLIIEENENIMFIRLGFFNGEIEHLKSAKIMLEKGNKATDWTPAPEDTQKELDNQDETIKTHSTQIKQNKESILNRATKTELDKANKRIDEAEGSVETLAGKVEAKASQSTVDTLEGRISTAEGELSVLPGEINAKVSKENAFGELNLSPDTAKLNFDRIDILGKLEAKHIKSLAGLNINDQFVVDSNGNVSIGNDSTTIDREGVTVKDGSFLLEDDTTRNPYSVKPGQNLIRDHSFELVKAVIGDRTDYTRYNWLDMYDAKRHEDVRTSWQIKYGSPMVATVFAPDKPEAMPMFGEKAIVIKLSNTVWQNVWNVSGGTTYTLSAFFRRHWNVKPGGKPAFSVFKLNNLGERVERLARKEFPAVKDDYSISRYSLTFTTPADMAVDESIEVVIWSSVDRWFQCDGVQLVEGNYPTVYDPEDSVWNTLNGYYAINRYSNILWGGALYLSDTEKVTPSKSIMDCTNGWILEWSRTGKDVAFNHTVIHKSNFAEGGGYSKNFHYLMSRSISNTSVGVTGKIIYTDGYTITGASTNNKSDNGSSRVQLRAVYEF